MKANIDFVQPPLLGAEMKCNFLATPQDVHAYLSKAKTDTYNVIDVETHGLNPFAEDAKILCLSIYSPSHGSAVIPWRHRDWKWGYGDYMTVFGLVSDYLRDTTPKIGHNLKYDVRWLRQEFDVRNIGGCIADTMLLARQYDENVASKKHGGVGSGLKALCGFYFAEDNWNDDLDKYKDMYCRQNGLHKSDWTYDYFPLSLLCDYAAKDVENTAKLYEFFISSLEESNLKVHRDISFPASMVFSEVEDTGMLVDTAALEGLKYSLKEEIAKHESNLRQYSECMGLNINSPAQIKAVLYEQLSLPLQKNHKTGKVTTDASALKRLSTLHPVPAILYQIKKADTMLNKYITNIEAHTDCDGRVRSNFNIDEAVTGRTSSSNPNFQNLSPAAKHVFIPKDGYTFVQYDYSQLELRILAVVANDEDMIKAFEEDRDIHTETSALIYNKEPNCVSDAERKVGKTIGFGIIYGMGTVALANRLFVSEDEAEKIYNAYMKKKPTIEKWIKETKKFAHNYGYVDTVFGRRRRLPKALHGDGGALRQAVNTRIQSPGNDITLSGIIRLDRAIKANNIDAKIVLSVHDSCLIECRDSYVQELSDTIEYICQDVSMYKWWNPRVPLKVDISAGKNYGVLAQIDTYMGELYE